MDSTTTNIDLPVPSVGIRELQVVYEIVRRCATGDTAAWDQLFQRFHAPLKARIRAFLGYRGQDAHLVEEIAAEVWLVLLEQDGRLLIHFRPGSSFLAYLSSIARYEALLHFRGSRRRRDREGKAIARTASDHVAWPEYSHAEFAEFLATLTRREREFLDTLLDPQNSQPPPNIAPSNLWQLRHRVRRKLCKYLES